jgi:cytochrome o ubiquinol oxidase subunit 1
VTILKMRAPGMTLMRMPMFIWTSLCSSILIISIFPILSLTLILLYLDRYFGMHFFTTDGGGNAMMYVNLIWSWGHPEVYVIILPAFGIFSEVVSTFAKKHLYSYKTGVAAAFGVLVLSMLVWLHHFFTMGAGANVNAFFGIMTTLIAIPTGVQFFNWLLTLYKGRITLSLPMYWFLAFAVTFTLGGMAGVLMAIPPLDFQIHNSLFLVAHFHTMVIGGAVFGIFAGLSYWFPKITGIKLNEKYGKISFWLWLIGFLVAFIPLYILGMLGATRRLDHYDASLGWQGLFVVALIGGLMIGAAVLAQIWQVVVSFKEKQVDSTGDPFDGRTLEWSMPSPPPIFNFAVIPTVTDKDAFWAMKQKEIARSAPASTSRDKAISYTDRSPRSDQNIGARDFPSPTYTDIHMPKNTAAGIYVSAFCFLAGFAFVWHIAWLQVVGILGAIIVVIHKSLEEETEYTIPAAEVERMEKERVSFYEPMSKISNS